ncbi:MAG: hypothetical protein DLM59_11190, partial [Pseudonocardiales bacterium]
AYEEAHRLWTKTGDSLAAATLVPPLVAVKHLLGETLDTRADLLDQTLADLPAIPGADLVRAQLLGALAAAYMLDRRLDESIAYGERSRALSGADQPDVNTAATLGSVLVFAGEMDSGWGLLEDAVARSVAECQEAEAARGYRMIGSSASVLVEYDRAEHWLDRGIAYADAVELWNHRNYMAAHRGHVQWACGQWGAAQQTAEQALADGRGGVTTRITAGYVLGFLAMGRGDWAAAAALLGEALEEGECMAELQRLSPPLWGLAETALLRGDHDTAVALCDRGYAASDAVSDAAYLFPYLVTGTRARLARGDHDDAERWVRRTEAALRHRAIPGTLPGVDHARGLLHLAAGDTDAARASLRRAREAWDGRRRFWEGQWATLDLAACATRSRRHAEAAALAGDVRVSAARAGASTLVAAADRLLHPEQSEPAARPWHPLSAREYAVADLVAAGLTNRQIAAELVLSPRTVSAHVAHILAKLGASRRAEIAAWAARVDA